jgi:hypothetical protein
VECFDPFLEMDAMWQTNDSDDVDRVVDDAQAKQKGKGSLGIDDVQILLSDLLDSGIDALFGWLKD